jgi:hypothetical protein
VHIDHTTRVAIFFHGRRHSTNVAVWNIDSCC